jgi:hypothetical protein
MTLYHGSYMAISSPLTGVGRKELDFGPGFYLTCLREQAERWARRVCVIRAKNSPTISVLLLSAKHDLPMPNLFLTRGWAYLCFMTSPLIRFPYRQEVLQMPVQA